MKGLFQRAAQWLLTEVRDGKTQSVIKTDKDLQRMVARIAEPRLDEMSRFKTAHDYADYVEQFPVTEAAAALARAAHAAPRSSSSALFLANRFVLETDRASSPSEQIDLLLQNSQFADPQSYLDRRMAACFARSLRQLSPMLRDFELFHAQDVGVRPGAFASCIRALAQGNTLIVGVSEQAAKHKSLKFDL